MLRISSRTYVVDCQKKAMFTLMFLLTNMMTSTYRTDLSEVIYRLQVNNTSQMILAYFDEIESN